MIRTFAAAGILFALSFPIGAAPRQQESAKPSAETQSPLPTPPASTTNSTKPKPKKVWTNENVPNSGEGVSVVGSGSSGNGGSKTQPRGAAATNGSIDPKVIASLREQLRRLQAQLAVVERQYSDLKAQSKGDSKSAGGLRQNTYTYDSSSVEEQLQHLQEKKKRIEATIDELLDAARKAGIEPGDLR
jgi:hypothetical protein